MLGNYPVAAQLVASRVVLSSMELVSSWLLSSLPTLTLKNVEFRLQTAADFVFCEIL
jgi:hypothetical protein